MTEMLTPMTPEIPFKFDDDKMQLLDKAIILTSRLKLDSTELFALSQSNPYKDNSFYRQQDLLEDEDLLLPMIEAIHRELFFNIQVTHDQLTDEQKIYFNSVFNNSTPEDGFDFITPNNELDIWRQLIPGSIARFINSKNSEPDSNVPAIEGMLAESPIVRIEFYEDNLVTQAFMTYRFTHDERDRIRMVNVHEIIPLG